MSIKKTFAQWKVLLDAGTADFGIRMTESEDQIENTTPPSELRCNCRGNSRSGHQDLYIQKGEKASAGCFTHVICVIVWIGTIVLIQRIRGKGGNIHGSKVNKAKDRDSRYRLNHGKIYEPDSIVFPRRRLICQQI
jgi:hypothetical protein